MLGGAIATEACINKVTRANPYLFLYRTTPPPPLSAPKGLGNSAFLNGVKDFSTVGKFTARDYVRLLALMTMKFYTSVCAVKKTECYEMEFCDAGLFTLTAYI